MNLHEIKEKSLLDCTGAFGKIGEFTVGGNIRKTHIRFKSVNKFEAYINCYYLEIDGEGANFTAYKYKSETPQINLVNKFQYGKKTGFKRDFSEYTGNYCYIPTSGYCFTERNKFSNCERF